MLLAFALALVASPVGQAPDISSHEALRAADGRLAMIGHRLATANSPLCDQLQPALGMAVHALNQYGGTERERARSSFHFTAPVAVEAIVPAGPADRAGIRQDDSLLAIDGVMVGGGGQGVTDRDRALDLLDRRAPNGRATLAIGRDGITQTIMVGATPGCRARFELLLGRGFYAGADDRTVHLGERFFERYTDAEIAVVVAHELAHVILRHADRLDAAKVNRGLLKEVGRNGRLFRRTEREADELGVHLLANAGYEPMSAARFWRSRGRDIDHGLFRSRTHPSSKARAEALEAVALAIAGRPRPIISTLLATRDQPLD